MTNVQIFSSHHKNKIGRKYSMQKKKHTTLKFQVQFIHMSSMTDQVCVHLKYKRSGK